MKNDLKARVLDIQNVTEFTFKDFPLFKDKIKAEKEVQYSNSWLYSLRSVVDDYGELGYKYSSDKFLFTMTFRHGQLVVGKVFGLNDSNFGDLVEIIEQVYDKLKIPIILKKVPSKILTKLLSNRYFHETLREELSSILLDETFPEKIINLDVLIKSKDNTLTILPKRFRNGVNRFKNRNIEIKEVKPEITTYEFINQKIYLRTVARGNGSKYLTYKPMLQYIFNDERSNSNFIVRNYFSQTGIEGYYILEKLGDDSIGFYCGLTSISHGGITEYLDSLIFIELVKMGYKNVYLGGSEHEGVVNYVTKLLPQNPTYSVTPLIYYR